LGPAASDRIQKSSGAHSGWATGVYEIIGVSGGPFTGTEPGTMIDIFLPAMMPSFRHPFGLHLASDSGRMKPGVAVEPLRQKLNAISLAFEQERAKGFTNDVEARAFEIYLHQTT